ncbi:MAG: carboxymuconolactone decarboxylase family protein [Faecalibacillus sp.]
MDREKKANDLFKQLNDEEFFIDDPELQEIMKKYIYGDVYHHGTLDLSIRELILIVVNTVNQTMTSLKQHVLSALKCQVEPGIIKEAIYQCVPYIGMGKVEESLHMVNLLFKENNISFPLKPMSTVHEDNRFDKGFDVQSEAFGREHIQANHNQAPQELKHIQNYLSAYCFGDFYTRKGLNLKQRELLTFVMLATLGGCENQLRAHIQANLHVGNDKKVLIETITQCQPYIGFPRTLNAIALINE